MSPQGGGGGEKTEKATPKKRRDARNKGQMVKSTDVVVALGLMLMLAGIYIFGAGLMANVRQMMISFFTVDMAGDFTAATLTAVGKDAILRYVTAMLPIFLIAMAGGVLFNVLQTGLLFKTSLLKPKFSRINPISGFKRIFSKKTLMDLLKSIIKLTVLAIIAYSEYQAQIVNIENMMGQSLQTSINIIVEMLYSVGMKLALALIIMAPFDLFIQWRKHEKDLMMSKQEIKDEYKLSEGNPEIKGRIKQKQRQMSAMRMMQAVGEADVVITNPTHYAVALAYDESKHTAPVIVAKGKDFLARKIKEEAAKHHVEMMENRELAQYLYFFCDIGDPVPEEMYQAVAEILAYIYKMKQGPQGVRH